MDEQLYLMAVGLSLAEKVEKAVLNYQYYEKEALRLDPVNGYWLCDSYGKDSGVILDLAKRSGVKFLARHNLTTLDPPELLQFGRKHHAETVVNRPEKPMLIKLIEKSCGPPTRLSRWCCEIYKEQGGKDKITVTGIRAAESARRKQNWKVWTPHRKKSTDSYFLNPILYWTDEDVWRYTKDNHIPYCCLYDEGKKRLGCIGCPMNDVGRVDDFRRWPRYEKAWKKAIEQFWNTWHGVPRSKKRWVKLGGKRRFVPVDGEEITEVDGEVGVYTLRRWFDCRGFSGHEDLWRWWMEEMPLEEDNDECQMGLF